MASGIEWSSGWWGVVAALRRLRNSLPCDVIYWFRGNRSRLLLLLIKIRSLFPVPQSLQVVLHREPVQGAQGSVTTARWLPPNLFVMLVHGSSSDNTHIRTSKFEKYYSPRILFLTHGSPLHAKGGKRSSYPLGQGGLVWQGSLIS